ncbi:MAG: site-specific DNA-methyltransferase [Phenylobacterium sp.]|uniref:site-specific DNA-methyltransferase n=1 Tax=Phenylobacterium sp. TaxID=1871053 RepID=UPI0025DF500F|nr:DNA methyltransferase [Phenylobacterium sp.]MCA6246107.1 site-specific DNA-methyltransferase [Phenylobacterium sp.]MCA6256101.1 site-specific DNA-methyltransferase [Phenylobacterium sp.]
MSRLTELISQAKAKDPALGHELEREFKVLSARRSFGLNFERHKPESVELPGRPIRKGDKVRILPPRGSTAKGDQRLWKVLGLEGQGEARQARLELTGCDEPEQQSASVTDLIVVAEFNDYIYPGLVNTGRIERGADKPFHTVINGENFHVLEALTFTHRGKIDAIYIDPPYNTGARDWKYNNDYVEGDDLYRHSKWLAMIERRLLVARQLLNPLNSVLIVTIDEKEYLRLGLLLEQIFQEATIQMVSIQINPANVARRGGFGRNDEYAFFVMFGLAGPQRVVLGADWVSTKGRTFTGAVRWDLLRRSGTNARRADRPKLFYPLLVNPETRAVVGTGAPPELNDDRSSFSPPEGLVTVWPIRKDGSDGNWQLGPTALMKHVAEGRVRLGGSLEKGLVVYYIKGGEYQKVLRGDYPVLGRNPDGSLNLGSSEEIVNLAVPGTQWKVAAHDATQYGSRLLSNLLPGRQFPFPKSLYAVEDALRFFVSDKPSAIILDFFAGSGTTAHAVMRLNRQDGGRRQCISITNNEVGPDEHFKLRKEGLRPGDPEWECWGICDHITKPRINAAISGTTPEGQSIKGEYKFTDESSMADGFLENAEFFTLTYETPVAVSHNRAFARIAPLLWMRAGSEGRRIDALPDAGWEVADTYGLLTELDAAAPFAETISKAHGIRIAYIVTDDERRFQAIVRQLPETVEPVRLYESYLTNFRFAMGR